VANIGKAITIRGDLTGNEDMVIEGKVEGKVDLPNNQLTVGANGDVKAEIHAKSVVVIGKLVGNVFGLERIEIQATGNIEGDVTAPKLVVAEGAQLNGAIQMTQKGSRTEGAGPEAATSQTAPGVRKAG
jgi:cytoskeletal protein CcmA (bactofilin family)